MKSARVMLISALWIFASCDPGSTGSASIATTSAGAAGSLAAALTAQPARDFFRPGDPISVPAMRWQYVGFPHTACLDGRSTGVGINLNPQSDKLLVFLDEGYIAFNALTGLIAPRSWGPTDLDTQPTGILDRAAANNPFREWNFVYIPACTGDLNAGATPHGYGDAPQQGDTNFGEYLARIVPTFQHVTRVVLSGSSSGAFGAAWNWMRTQDAFGEIPVDLLSDSAPPMGLDFIPGCAVKRFAEVWNLRASLHPACAACDLRTGNLLPPLLDATLDRVGPAARAGFITYDEDATMKTFIAFGLDNCAHVDDLIPPEYPPGKFPAGLTELRSRMATRPNVAFYEVAGEGHVFFHDAFTATSNGVKLSDWLSAFVNGGPGFTNVVP